MTEIELLTKAIKQQDDFINLLRAKVDALELVLKNHVPNFEQQYARALSFHERIMSHPVQTVAVISHGFFISTLYADPLS